MENVNKYKKVYKLFVTRYNESQEYNNFKNKVPTLIFKIILIVDFFVDQLMDNSRVKGLNLPRYFFLLI